MIVTDQNSCSSVCLVEVLDGNQVPLLSCSEENELNLGCNPETIISGEEVIAEGYISSVDSLAVIRLVSEINTSDSCIRFRTYGYVATNDCGLTSDTCSFTISWQVDTIPPLLPEMDTILFVSCNVPIVEALTITDGCGETITALPEDDYEDGTCVHDHKVIRTWTFQDSCGNTSVLRQVINVSDNAVPCLLYTSPSPRDRQKSRMPSSA